jgi:hypothetical protein
MRTTAAVFIATWSIAVALLAGSPRAHAQTIDGAASVALKNGETIEVGPVYWVSNCKSILKSMPAVEILDGPHGVSATVKEAMVLPRRQHCANKVAGGMLMLSAQDVEDQSYSNMTLRLTYQTRDGERKFSHVFNVSLIP